MQLRTKHPRVAKQNCCSNKGNKPSEDSIEERSSLIQNEAAEHLEFLIRTDSLEFYLEFIFLYFRRAHHGFASAHAVNIIENMNSVHWLANFSFSIVDMHIS